MRALAFAVVFLTGTACHREVKLLETVKAVESERVKVESVTTAPTERTTQRWYFSVTPGVGRQLPAGDGASRPLAQREGAPPPAGFSPSPGLGYALDEYERIDETLKPVATTKTEADKKSDTTTVKATERETDVGPGLKFYLALAIVFILVLVGVYLYLKHGLPGGLLALIKKVLP